MRLNGFRPLAGINCNAIGGQSTFTFSCFRPLAGINCNYKSGEYMVWTDGFPSPRGDKLQPADGDKTSDVDGWVSVPSRG